VTHGGELSKEPRVIVTSIVEVLVLVLVLVVVRVVVLGSTNSVDVLVNTIVVVGAVVMARVPEILPVLFTANVVVFGNGVASRDGGKVLVVSSACCHLVLLRWAVAVDSSMTV